jgi:hypothetical protein|nr:hypothetical protein KS05_04045 [Rhizobium brockwellii]
MEASTAAPIARPNLMPIAASSIPIPIAMAIGELDRFDAAWIADDEGHESLRQMLASPAAVLI